MAARLTALLPRFLALTVIWLLGAATYTLAADTVPIAKHEKKAEAAAKPHVLMVPDVRKKAYVFAKGILQDAGFAWRVEGTVKGFSANTVTVQRPAPGTKVIDNGAPLVVLSLSRNTTYGESGLPENSAPYKATRVVLVSDWARDQIEPTTSGETETTSTETGATTTAPAATTTEPAATTTEPAATTTEPEQPEEKTRKPDFEVPGAPVEPADEMPLPDRARALERRLAGNEQAFPAAHQLLAVPALLDRHGRPLRLARRRPGASHPDQGRPEPRAPLRIRREERGRRPPRARLRRGAGEVIWKRLRRSPRRTRLHPGRAPRRPRDLHDGRDGAGLALHLGREGRARHEPPLRGAAERPARARPDAARAPLLERHHRDVRTPLSRPSPSRCPRSARARAARLFRSSTTRASSRPAATASGARSIARRS